MKTKVFILERGGSAKITEKKEYKWFIEGDSLYFLTRVFTNPKTGERIAVFSQGNPIPYGGDEKKVKELAESLFRETTALKLADIRRREMPKWLPLLIGFLIVIFTLMKVG